jgi:hypothetical protein
MRDGVKVLIGDVEYVVPRLKVNEFKAISMSAKTITDENAADSLLEQMASVLRINYPEITAAALGDSICFGDLIDTHGALLAAAGAKRSKSQGEAVSP